MYLIEPPSPFGVIPHYVSKDKHAHCPCIRGLLNENPFVSRSIDPSGLRSYLLRAPDGISTCFSDVTKVPPQHALYEHPQRCFSSQLTSLPPLDNRPLLTQLTEAVGSILSASHRVALALSGGLDSAIVLALVQQHSLPVTVCTVVSHLPGYCERNTTRETAQLLGCSNLLEIEILESDLMSAFPSAIAACETPLFNAHPVSRWLLAQRLAKLGFDTLLTGDAADQVFCGTDGRNYLPIVGALVHGAGLKLASPFFDLRFQSWAQQHGTDPNKQPLRDAAAQILPTELITRPKAPRLAPDLDLAHLRNPNIDEQIQQMLGVAPPSKDPSANNTLWATIAVLIESLGGTF